MAYDAVMATGASVSMVYIRPYGKRLVIGCMCSTDPSEVNYKKELLDAFAEEAALQRQIDKLKITAKTMAASNRLYKLQLKLRKMQEETDEKFEEGGN